MWSYCTCFRQVAQNKDSQAVWQHRFFVEHALTTITLTIGRHSSAGVMARNHFEAGVHYATKRVVKQGMLAMPGPSSRVWFDIPSPYSTGGVDRDVLRRNASDFAAAGFVVADRYKYTKVKGGRYPPGGGTRGKP